VWRAAGAREGAGQQAQIGELDLAHYLCRGGHGEEGLRHAGAAHAQIMDIGGAAPPLTHAAAFTLGECLMATGRAEKALALYRGVDPVAVGQLVGDAEWAPNLYLAMAEAHLGRGDRVQAGAFLDRVGPAFDGAAADAAQRDRVRRLRIALR